MPPGRCRCVDAFWSSIMTMKRGTWSVSICSGWGSLWRVKTVGFSGLVRIAQEKERAPFDGLILELDMPLLGGMAILQEIRDRHSEIPVIVTALSSEIKRLRDAVNLGAKEYLVKPFDAELFARKCRRIFPDSVGSI